MPVTNSLPRCTHLGPPIQHEGIQVFQACEGCPGTVRQKLFECRHPSHAITTIVECRQCPDFSEVSRPGAAEEVEGVPVRDPS